jgi:predicted PurR-regulated permease PerM
MNLQKIFLLGLTGLLGLIAWLMIKPLLAFVITAIMLAFLLYPLQIRLENYIGESITASLLIVFAVLVAIVPISMASAAVVQDAGDLANDLNQTNLVNTTEIEHQVKRFTGRSIDIEASVDSTVNEFTAVTFGSVSQIVDVVSKLAIGITLMLFLVYYLLKDGDVLVAWLRDATPLDNQIQDSLYERIDKTTWAVIKGHVLVAVVQGLVAGLGLAVTGIPNYVFWTFVMVLLGFIPVIGTIVIWLPAALYLFAIGNVNQAIFLLIYGFLIVGTTDNVLRPLVVDRGANLHPAVIIVGVIGGVYLFGAIGLFIGPILLGILKSVIVVLESNYEEL